MAYIKLDENIGFTNHQRVIDDLISLAKSSEASDSVHVPYSLLAMYGNNFINATRLDYGAREYRYHSELLQLLQDSTYSVTLGSLRISWFWLAICLAIDSKYSYAERSNNGLNLNSSLASLFFSGIEKYRLERYVDESMILQLAGFNSLSKKFVHTEFSPLVRLILIKKPSFTKKIKMSSRFLGYAYTNKLLYLYCVKRKIIHVNLLQFNMVSA
jgi:hypothetical protein